MSIYHPWQKYNGYMKRIEENLFRDIIVAAIILFNIIDLLVTYYFVEAYGLHLEQNPLARFCIAEFGWPFTCIVKLAIGFIASYLMRMQWHHYAPTKYYALGIIAVYGAVLILHALNIMAL